MKIALSKPNDERGQHIVLVCDSEESWKASSVITSEILQNRARPVKETRSNSVIFRFHMRFLDRLSLAFPMAELSEGVHSKLKKAEEKRLADMPVPTCSWPGFEGTLYDYQKIAAKMVVDGEIDYLNDEMGLGKTFIALAAIRKMKAFPALVVCPNSAKFTWAEVLDEFFPGVSYAVVDGNKAQRAEAIQKRADITIINFEGIRAKAIHEGDNPYAPVIGYEYSNPDLFDYPYSFAVVDEHHRVKTPGAQVTFGFFELIAEQWLMMSGTPILNRPEEIWTVLHKIYPEEFPSYNGFINSIGVFAPGSTYIVAYRPDPMSELRQFIASVSLRRRREQVLKDLPQVVHVPRVVKQSKEERKLYEKIRDDLLLELEDGTTKNIMGVLPQITRLKQACFSPELYGGSKKSSKMEELKEIVEELVASGEKAIIFSQWSTATRIIERELGSLYGYAYVTGEVKPKDRSEQVRKFIKDDDCKLYIGTIAANREAINLGIATYVIFTDDGWTPAEKDQAIGRSAAGGLRGAHLGADTKVHVITLQAEDTYEQRIDALLNKKRALFDRMVERDGGKKIEKVTVDDIKDLL